MSQEPSTAASVIPKSLWVQGVVNVEPGRDIKFTTDACGAFTKTGGLPVEGAEAAAMVTHQTNTCFGPDNCLFVNEAHVKGSTHSTETYEEEAGVVPNLTQTTPELIKHWMQIGESHVLRPHAQFGLNGALMAARLSKMVTGSWPTIWSEHGIVSTIETCFIPPITIKDYSMSHYKGTHPLYDSHSGIIDASGVPVGTLTTIASRHTPVRAIFCDGNALEVCIYLTLKHLAERTRHLDITIYCIVDATGFLPFIDAGIRNILIKELVGLGVKFVHSSQLKFN